MRITIKQQVMMAPATVLILLVLLLGFMHFTYWDLSHKRRDAKAVEETFMAVAEADLSARRLHLLLRGLHHTGIAAPEDMALVSDLYEHLLTAVARMEPFGPLKQSGQIEQIRVLAESLNPADSPDEGRTAELFARLRGELSTLSSVTQIHRSRMRLQNEKDISQLVEQTTFVAIMILTVAILLGLFLSIYFSRRLLQRIQLLSRSAVNIADGHLELPEAPDHIRDELDTLAMSINRMTKRLIRVVGTEKLLEGAEEERRRIAMDLHDQSLSDLSTILRGLQALQERSDDPFSQQQSEELADDLERAISNLRDIMNNLHPQTLDILGLGAAIEAHLEQHCQAAELPEYYVHVDPRVNSLALDRVRQLSLYRIAIEAVQNVIKHAAASRYEVSLEVQENRLLLVVEDNGCGFSEPVGHSGRGLNNIRERARAINAEVCWKASRFSSGTRFELTLTTASA